MGPAPVLAPARTLSEKWQLYDRGRHGSLPCGEIAAYKQYSSIGQISCSETESSQEHIRGREDEEASGFLGVDLNVVGWIRFRSNVASKKGYKPVVDRRGGVTESRPNRRACRLPVSYTHLTLPTNREV